MLNPCVPGHGLADSNVPSWLPERIIYAMLHLYRKRAEEAGTESASIGLVLLLGFRPLFIVNLSVSIVTSNKSSTIIHHDSIIKLCDLRNALATVELMGGGNSQPAVRFFVLW